MILLEEREYSCFKVMAPDKLDTLQWVATHPGVRGKHNWTQQVIKHKRSNIQGRIGKEACLREAERSKCERNTYIKFSND